MMSTLSIVKRSAMLRLSLRRALMIIAIFVSVMVLGFRRGSGHSSAPGFTTVRTGRGTATGGERDGGLGPACGQSR